MSGGAADLRAEKHQAPSSSSAPTARPVGTSSGALDDRIVSLLDAANRDRDFWKTRALRLEERLHLLADDIPLDGGPTLSEQLRNARIERDAFKLKAKLFDESQAVYAVAHDESIQKMLAAFDQVRAFADENATLKDEVARVKRALLLLGGTP